MQNLKKCVKRQLNYYPNSLEYVPDCYITQEMCEKAVDTYPSTVIHVFNCYKTQKICEKAVDTCPFMLY